MRHHTQRAAVLVLLAAVGCAGEGAQSSCDDWKSQAKAHQACYPLGYPPVADDGKVSCVSDDHFSALSGSDPLFSDIDTIDGCADYLRRFNSPCEARPSEAGRSRAETDQRIAHCTVDVVADWTPPSNGDACARWKAASAYFSACDSAIFSEYATSARCVSDAQVAERTAGRFTSLDECAQYVYSMAFPCTVALGTDRELCSNLILP